MRYDFVRAAWTTMDQTLFTVGNHAVSVGAFLVGLATLAAGVLLVLLVVVARSARERREDAAMDAVRAEEIEERLGDVARIQAETAGRLHTMGEVLSGRQAELARAVADRLDAVTHRVGQSMESTTRHTAESLRHLHERLAIIDSAQKNITDLASQVTSLREVLANKQARGAFGQGRMEAIVRDGLPKGGYAFQFTLRSNRMRPDCVVFLPGDERPLVIDAKFPLEAVTALREATTDDTRKHAAQRLRHDIIKHVNDIAERYLVPGETQDLALMFVPSESVYAEIHDGFDDVVQRAYRSRVVLVSPSLLMLAIQVMQQIFKDARMRDAADKIRTEVECLLDDVRRLQQRVGKLQSHFTQASDDVSQILVSAEKIAVRGGRITELEFEDGPPPASGVVIPTPMTRKLEAGE